MLVSETAPWRLCSLSGRCRHDAVTATVRGGFAAAQLLAADHRSLRRSRGAVCQAFRALAGVARAGGDARLPTPPLGEEGVVESVQSGGVRLALLLRQDAGPQRSRADAALWQKAQDGGVRVESAGGRATPGRGATGARACAAPDRLRLRPALDGSAQLADPGHRQRPHARARAPGQGKQGSARALVTEAADGVA